MEPFALTINKGKRKEGEIVVGKTKPKEGKGTKEKGWGFAKRLDGYCKGTGDLHKGN